MKLTQFFLALALAFVSASFLVAICLGATGLELTIVADAGKTTYALNINWA